MPKRRAVRLDATRLGDGTPECRAESALGAIVTRCEWRHEITVDLGVAERARGAIERMVAIG